MTDDEVRSAWLRIADPFGTRARAVLLSLSLFLVAVFAAVRMAGNQRMAMVVLTVAATAVYGFISLRARRSAAALSAPEARARFLSKARGTLTGASILPVRGLLWGAFGAWSAAGAAGVVRFPFFEQPDLQVFLSGASLLFATRYFVEWLVEVPRLRLEVASLAAPGSGGGSAPTPPQDPPPVDPS